MSTYLYMNDFSQSAIKKGCYNKAFESIQKAVSDSKWDHYGWVNDVRKATTLEEIAHQFGIDLEERSDGIHWMMDNTYHSMFFVPMACAIAELMTDGNERIDEDGEQRFVSFKDGKFHRTIV